MVSTQCGTDYRSDTSYSWPSLRPEGYGGKGSFGEIVQRAPEEQLRKLVVEPLATLEDDPACPTLVIVLDGLDEYNPDVASQIILDMLTEFSKLPAAIKLIITSRPDPHLTPLCKSGSMTSLIDISALAAQEMEAMQGDIRLYLKRKLPQMVWQWVDDPSDWPGEERRRVLVRMSQGLWIWVTTVALMVADRTIRQPEQQLQAVLSSESTHGTTEGAIYGHNSHLYAIYAMILDRACSTNPSTELLDLFPTSWEL